MGRFSVLRSTTKDEGRRTEYVRTLAPRLFPFWVLYMVGEEGLCAERMTL